ncbi:UbiD family decarboxylase [Methanorbis rubei]|uniref:Anhydromevalonate phosphate decarboxylase n=1 Tax=Methanorbis rubei TaxID=3028300 RepID=A0AAE4SAQ7_9EURY|nr:3-octaprenyl-4-hydroxybenzoate carboxy-lyase [Methanocorpusculaceae archaeon Cs1]
MREFIKRMIANGLVEEISEPVSSIYEAPKQAYYNSKKMLYFHNCDGHECVMNTIFDRRSLSVALNIPEDKLVKTLASCTYSGKTHNAGKLTFVPAKLSALPIMKHFPKDAGRYLTSGVVFSALDGVENASIHRLEVLDDTHLIGRIVEGRHTYKLLQQAKAAGKKLPIAITVGTHPAVTFAACTRVPEGKEMAYAAEILGEDMPLYECPNGIRVPDAEIVLYGYMTADLHEEGPFVDISGTYDPIRMQPVIELEGMACKPDFIYHGIVPAGAEHKMLMGAPYEPRIYQAAANVTNVRDVYLTPGGAGYFHAVVQVKKMTNGDGKNVIMAAFAAHTSLKHVVVVDEDINIYDPNDVEFAIATRVRADQDVMIIAGVRGSSLDPCRIGDGMNVKMGIDATMNLGHEDEFIRAGWDE